MEWEWKLQSGGQYVAINTSTMESNSFCIKNGKEDHPIRKQKRLEHALHKGR